jgi:hypothetical protein
MWHLNRRVSTWPPLVDQLRRDYYLGLLCIRSTTNLEGRGSNSQKKGRMTDDHLGLNGSNSRPNSPMVHKMPSSDAMRSDEDEVM